MIDPTPTAGTTDGIIVTTLPPLQRIHLDYSN
jgi:hypothetical protein